MAYTLAGIDKKRQRMPPVGERLKVTDLRIRPTDAGFSSYDAAWSLPPNKSPQQRVEYDKNFVIRPRGGLLFLTAPASEPVTYLNVFEFNNTTNSVGFFFTLTKAYWFDEIATPGTWVIHGPIPGPAFTSVPYERWFTAQLDFKVYAVSYNNSLMYGDGAGMGFVPGAHPARSMFMLNNHMILAGLNDATVGPDFSPDFQEILWSQIFTTHPISCAGAGSGRASLSDTTGIIMNAMPLSPLNAFVYKSDAIIEMRSTGDAALPFEFVERTRSMGIMYSYSLVQFKGTQIFCGTDYQIYQYDGSQFKEIGNDVRNEIETVSQPGGFVSASLQADRAIGMFDFTTREYMLAVGTPGTSMIVFAYNVDRKRWRVCEYENLSYWVTKRFKRPAAIGHMFYTSYYPFCCTTTGKILYLENTPNFDTQMPVPFLYQTPDFVGQKDGEEGTLLQVIVAIANNSPVTLTMDISHDSGNSWGPDYIVTSRSSPPFEAEQVSVFDVFETGLKFRLRFRNSVADQVVRIEGITLRISSVGEWRREAV
jgi:hypothetical protein